jgi:polyketide cyclase/dehydrase/lipid transport protein
MPKVSVSSTVPASPDATWATAADLSRFGEWLVLHDGWRGEVPGELQVGTELTSVVTVKGLRNRISWLVDSYDPPRSLTITGKGVGGTRVSLALSVHAAGDTSTVTVDAEITGPTTIGPVGMLIGRALKGDMRRSVARLTDLLG